MNPLEILRDKRQFIPDGFTDDDGVRHEGPHRREFNNALRLLEYAMDYAYRMEAPGGRVFCNVCRRIGGHMETCPVAKWKGVS